MDPDSNLEEMLEIATALQDESRLAELVVALDGWLRGGGFLPQAWRDCPRSVESDDFPAKENADASN